MTVTSFIKTGTFVLRKEFMSDRSHTSMSGPLGSDLRTLYPHRSPTQQKCYKGSGDSYTHRKLYTGETRPVSGTKDIWGKVWLSSSACKIFFFFLLFEVSRKGSIAGGWHATWGSKPTDVIVSFHAFSFVTMRISGQGPVRCKDLLHPVGFIHTHVT